MISIIIVTYNASLTLQNCLDSIYKQRNRKHINIIIVDGKSSDGTVSILESNNNEIDDWISEKDNGIYDAMNKGIAKIKTPWVYFLGADDELLPDFSEIIEQLDCLTSIYYSNVLYKGGKYSGKLSSYYQAKLGIFHQSIIYPSAVFKKYQYHPKYKIAADYALNMQLNKDKNFHFEYKDYTIAKYNDTGISSQAIDEAFENDKLRLIYHNFGLLDWMRFYFRKLKGNLKT